VEEKKGGFIMRETTINREQRREGRRIFPAVMVPRQCPFSLLVNVC
jgi:hypothetical protein